MRDEVFKALADPTRRRILRLLSTGEMGAGELAQQFDITAPSMSHHFNVLRQAGLITSRKEGQQVIYVLNTTVVQDIVGAMLDMFSGKQPEMEIEPK